MDDEDYEDDLEFLSDSKSIEDVELSPESPAPDEEITAKVYDDDGDELEDAKIKVTRLGTDEEWDTDDEFWNVGYTNSDGEKTFTLTKKWKDAYGAFQIDAYKSEYCKRTVELLIYRNITIGDPSPSTPRAGQTITIRITDDKGDGISGVKITVSGPGMSPATYTTDRNGYVPFTVSGAGDYSIYAEKSGYPSKTRTITVASKATPDVSISTLDQAVGSSITITVTSGGSAIAGASVTITKPNGDFDKFTTSSSGTVSYTPASVGSYSVKVEEPSYTTSTTSFKAHGTLSVTTSPSTLKAGDAVTVLVKDQSGLVAPGVTVSTAEDASITQVTDDSGIAKLTLPDAKAYTITAKKTDYADGTASVTPSGGALSMTVSKTEISLGDETIITVKDETDKEISVTIAIEGPESTTVTDKTYTFKPGKAGSYTITASKTGYTTATDSVKVSPRPVDIATEVEDSTLFVTITSGNATVSNVTVKVETESGWGESSTDASGVAMFNIEGTSGKITVSLSDPNYLSATKTVEVGYTKKVMIAAGAVVLVIVVALVLQRSRKKSIFKQGRSRL